MSQPHTGDPAAPEAGRYDDPPDRLFKLPLPAGGLLEKLLGVDQLNAMYARCAGAGGVPTFLRRVLDDLDVRFRLPAEDLARIPKSGPLVVVANHPFGALDGIILAAVLSAVRPDVKVMANYLLGKIPDLRDLFILVDPFGGDAAAAANVSPLRRAVRWLKAGGVLATFPAGEVAHVRWRDALDPRAGGTRLRDKPVTDPVWGPTVARLVRRAGVPALPVFFDGRNGPLFQALGLVHPRLRTAMLAREFLNKRGARVDLRIGSVVPARRLAAVDGDDALTDYLRGRTFLLRHSARTDPPAPSQAAVPRPTPPAPAMEPIAPPVDPALLAADVAALPAGALLASHDDLLVYHARAPQLRNVLRELGRLREATFRAAGEGTGKAQDVDTFDYDYVHLFVWHRARSEVVGAYRLGATDELLPAKGRLGLYTSTLFNYKAALLERMGPALEMGRSFVRVEYQRSYAPLLLLWKGIGAYLCRNPRYRHLFGPVSISNNYQTVSRQLMVQFLRLRHALPGGDGLARPRHRFRPRPPAGWDRDVARGLLRDPATGAASAADEDVSDLVSDLEPDAKGIPVLLRQYLKLGAKFVSFNVDPAFSDALDGLIVVDLMATEPRVLEKYMTREGYAGFRAYHEAGAGVVAHA